MAIMANRVVQGLAALVAVLGLACGAQAGDDGCEPGWVQGQFLPVTTTDRIHALGEFEVGTQTGFYIGGQFTATLGRNSDYVAVWNGEQWEPLLGQSGLGITPSSSTFQIHGVRALVSFDDGDGPALYAAGEFEFADGQVVNNIAKWDGVSWSPLAGPDGVGLDGRVACLYVFDDGSGPALYAGGEFSNAGGVPAERVARWDGAAWSALTGVNGAGIGPSGSANAISSYDDGGGEALFVAGSFLSADGVSANGIARWDGVAWQSLEGPGGPGVNGVINDLAVYGNAFFGFSLYVAGEFTEASGIECNRIAKWNGSDWSPVIDNFGSGANGTDDDVLDLEVFDDGSGSRLYLVGRFDRAGNRNVCGFSKWDGLEYSELDLSEIPGFILPPVSCATPRAMGIGNLHGQPVLCLSHSSLGLGERLIHSVLVWNGDNVSELAFPSDRSGVEDLVTDVEQFGAHLYVGGYFNFAGGRRHNGIARWDGSTWSPLIANGANGILGRVNVLHATDDETGPSLLVGGSFQFIGDQLLNNISRWDGNAWHPIVSGEQIGTFGEVLSLADFDDGQGRALYVGGEFIPGTNGSMNPIGKWDGQNWSSLDGPLASGLDSYFGASRVHAMAVFDDGTGAALYVGGEFDLAGGVEVSNIAKWNGTEWSALRGPSGTGVTGDDARVSALTVYDDGTGPSLYVGGFFRQAGGMLVNNIARWDGFTWAPLVTGRAIGVDSSVTSFSTTRDLVGESLLVGGGFVEGGERLLNGIGKWNGVEWQPLEGVSGVGVGAAPDRRPYITAISRFDDGVQRSVFFGGAFVLAGGQPSAHIAEWRECLSEPCPADVSSDGLVDLIDLNLVLANFGQSSADGDATGDGNVDLADLNAVLGAFGTVCP